MPPTQDSEPVGGHRPPGASVEPREILLLILILLTGAAIRLYRLEAQSVWYDEAFSVAHSVQPLPGLFEVLIRDFFHPPLHYLVLHGWFHLVGFGAMQARMVSVILGTSSIPLLFLLARRFTDSSTSLVAALLLAISQMAVYFSQEARAYAQTQFLSLLAALAFLRFLEKPTLQRAMAFTVAAIALLYTHYYGAATLLALGLYWFTFRRDYFPGAWRWLAAMAALLAVACLPWALALQSGGQDQEKVIDPGIARSERSNLSSPAGALNRFNNTKLTSVEAPTAPLPALLGLVLFTLPAVAALWYSRRSGPHGPVLGLLLAATPVAMAIALGAIGVIFNYRHYSFAVPGYYLAVAIGAKCCLRHRITRSGWLAAVALLSFFALTANHSVTKPDYREGFRPLAQNFRSGDCVTVYPRIWNPDGHLAWHVYHRDRGSLRYVPLASLPAVPIECQHLWVVWDRTWWMNLNPAATAKSEEAIASLRNHFTLVERYEHPVISLRRLQRLLNKPDP